jgi:hypothetical protein
MEGMKWEFRCGWDFLLYSRNSRVYQDPLSINDVYMLPHLLGDTAMRAVPW